MLEIFSTLTHRETLILTIYFKILLSRYLRQGVLVSIARFFSEIRKDLSWHAFKRRSICKK